MNSIEIKSVRSEDSSSSTSHVELIAAPVQPDPTETAPPEAPLPEEPPFGPVADFTMSSNNSTPVSPTSLTRKSAY